MRQKDCVFLQIAISISSPFFEYIYRSTNNFVCAQLLAESFRVRVDEDLFIIAAQRKHLADLKLMIEVASK